MRLISCSPGSIVGAVTETLASGEAMTADSA